MLSKARIKYIKSLQLKKKRLQEKLFLVEGAKSVLEFVNSKFTTAIVYGTKAFAEENVKILRQTDVKIELASKDELRQAGSLVTNNATIALVKMPEPTVMPLAEEVWTIALDTINDPGNFGTIIRIADWYGIRRIVVSDNSVDVFNPKVVTASKGSLTRVQVANVDLPKLLSSYNGSIIGADLAGKNVYSFDVKKGGVLVMGSESHGISAKLKTLLTDNVAIPRIGKAESLNVAVATAIICDNLIGRSFVSR